MIPEPINNLFLQFPFLGILIWLWFANNKERQAEARRNREYLDHMLGLQRDGFEKLFTIYRDFSRDSLLKADSRLNELSGRLDKLSNQLAVNTGVINEVAKIDDVVDRLFDKLNNK